MKIIKTKPMLPSLREKKRYIAFEVLAKKKMTSFSKVSSAVWESSLAFLGELGVGKAGLWILPDMWNPKLQRGLIKVNHKHVHNIKAALTLIEKINRQNVIVRSVGVSGILKKAKEKYIAG